MSKQTAKSRKSRRAEEAELRRAERRGVRSVQQLRAGPGPEFTDAKGKKWRLGFNTQDAKGRLEEIIRADRELDALDMVSKLPVAKGEEYWERHRNRVDTGLYFSFAVGWQRCLFGVKGALYFALSLLQEHHPNVTVAEVEDLLRHSKRQLKAAMGVVAPNFFFGVMRQISQDDVSEPDLWRLATTFGPQVVNHIMGGTPAEKLPDDAERVMNEVKEKIAQSRPSPPEASASEPSAGETPAPVSG